MWDPAPSVLLGSFPAGYVESGGKSGQCVPRGFG